MFQSTTLPHDTIHLVLHCMRLHVYSADHLRRKQHNAVFSAGYCLLSCARSCGFSHCQSACRYVLSVYCSVDAFHNVLIICMGSAHARWRAARHWTSFQVALDFDLTSLAVCEEVFVRRLPPSNHSWSRLVEGGGISCSSFLVYSTVNCRC